MKKIALSALLRLAVPAVAAAAAFGVGAGCGANGVFDGWLPAGPAAQQQPVSTPQPTPAVRVSNGMVEWSLGRGWHSAGGVEDLSAGDLYAPAAVWDTYPTAQEVLESLPEDQQPPPRLSFGEAAVPTPTPAPTPPPPPPVVAGPAAPGSGGGGGDHDHGGGDGGGGSPSDGGGGGGDAPSGGDGEDIGWSGDVLD